MTNYFNRLPCVLLMCAAPAWAAGSFIAPRAAAVPGGVITFKLAGAADTRPLVSYEGKPVLVARQPDGWLAIIGISLDTEPGEYHVDVQQPGANSRPLSFTIGPKQYAVQQLKVPPSQVNLSPEDEARVARETEKVHAALAIFTADAPVTLRLAQPVPGPRSSSLACDASSMVNRASRTAAWTSPRRPALRSRHRSPAASSTWAATSSMATMSSSTTAKD